MDSPLLDIVRSWSYWDRPPPPTIRRTVATPDALVPSLVLVVQGVRRCGKSTLLRQLMTRYALPPEHCAFLNFEDPRLAQRLSWQTLDAVVEAFRSLHPTAARRVFFLDEIQHVAGWERWLRARVDRPDGDHFVITGSNAALLSGELGSALTGRNRTIELFPFSFEEFRLLRPHATIHDYLHAGGFPEPLTLSDGDDLLRRYFHDIVERDVRERLQARSSLPIRQTAQMVFEAAGSELSLRRVSGALGIAIETAGSYLAACESAYLLVSVPFFAYSERKRAARHKKYYPIDHGLRRTVTTPGPPDRGKALECAVAIALRRHHTDISFWRGKGEVDFVVREGGRVVPVQVSLDGPLPRHEQALQDFYETFPHAGEAVFVSAEDFPEFEASSIP